VNPGKSQQIFIAERTLDLSPLQLFRDQPPDVSAFLKRRPHHTGCIECGLPSVTPDNHRKPVVCIWLHSFTETLTCNNAFLHCLNCKPNNPDCASARSSEAGVNDQSDTAVGLFCSSKLRTSAYRCALIILLFS